MTSPPFLALRSYLPADHPDKAREIGSEPTPAAFIDTLLDVVEALDRVLAPHGSICIELGDTYAGGGDSGWHRSGNLPVERSLGCATQGVTNSGPAWPMDKSLCLIPESFRWALAYGRNPFNGRETAPWRVRNVVRWHRPNPPVGALGDKFRPATSDLVVATKSRTRYFDLDAVRGPGSPNTHARLAQGVESRPTTGKKAENPNNNYGSMNEVETASAPPLDTWIIPTAPYKGSHYATFPPELCIIPVKAMCPLKVCRVCGEPSRRIVGDAEYFQNGIQVHNPNPVFRGDANYPNRPGTSGATAGRDQGSSTGTTRVNPTIGWTDCGHGRHGPDGKVATAWRNGVVLDPFAGSGTTLAVATGHGRDAIGIDLDSRNADLALERVGPFILTIETPEAVA